MIALMTMLAGMLATSSASSTTTTTTSRPTSEEYAALAEEFYNSQYPAGFINSRIENMVNEVRSQEAEQMAAAAFQQQAQLPEEQQEEVLALAQEIALEVSRTNPLDDQLQRILRQRHAEWQQAQQEYALADSTSLTTAEAMPIYKGDRVIVMAGRYFGRKGDVKRVRERSSGEEYYVVDVDPAKSDLAFGTLGGPSVCLIEEYTANELERVDRTSREVADMMAVAELAADGRRRRAQLCAAIRVGAKAVGVAAGTVAIIYIATTVLHAIYLGAALNGLTGGAGVVAFDAAMKAATKAAISRVLKTVVGLALPKLLLEGDIPSTAENIVAISMELLLTEGFIF